MNHLTSFAFALPVPILRTGGLLVLAVSCFLSPVSCFAERGDRDQPIHFSANKSEAINYETKVATLSGNVIITQGTMVLHADRVTFKQNPDNTLSAKAFGNPVTFRQKRDDSDEFIEAFAQRVEYDGHNNLLELFDQALLKRQKDEIRSNYISYNTQTEVFRAEGRPGSTHASDTETGDRVTGTFSIPEKEEHPAPNPPAGLKSDPTLTQPKGTRR